MRTFHGTIPALVTPFTPNNQVNVTVVQELVDHLMARKVDGLYLCGSTGEGAFMSVEERRIVVETVTMRVNGRMPVLVHVGAAAPGDAIRLAQHAHRHGAAGISSILPPVLYDARGIVAYFENLATAVPEMPFFPYIFGGARDADALMRDLLYLPNLAGTKYTGPDMYEMSRIVALREHDWTVFSGMDEQCLFARMFGARGNIGSTVNLMPGAYGALHRAFESGDWAHALDLQKRINRVIATLCDFGFTGAFKATFQFLGFDCGQPRVPNIPLPESELADLRAALHAVGFFELTAM
jgi:N-acetylneuraminate lyase